MEMFKAEYQICPRCLKYHPLGAYKRCVYCSYEHLITYTFEASDDDSWSSKKDADGHANSDALYGNPEFSEKLYKRRLRDEHAIEMRHLELQRSQIAEQKKGTFVPKCPTCGSTNVEKISTAQKALGFALVGLFSSNLGKTMHCKDCGYKW